MYISFTNLNISFVTEIFTSNRVLKYETVKNNKASMLNLIFSNDPNLSTEPSLKAVVPLNLYRLVLSSLFLFLVLTFRILSLITLREIVSYRLTQCDVIDKSHFLGNFQ